MCSSVTRALQSPRKRTWSISHGGILVDPGATGMGKGGLSQGTGKSEGDVDKLEKGKKRENLRKVLS